LSIAVWDPLVRLAHWGLAASVVLAWLTRHGYRPWHEALGYAVLALVALRVAWGFLGPRRARFSGFVRGPARTLGYAGQLLAGRAPRHLGLNPIGAWMAVALLATAALTALSGWLFVTDRFWGVPWVEAVHGAASNGLLGLIGLHVAGVLFTSWRQRENLPAAMLHGRKRASPGVAGPEDSGYHSGR